MTDTQTLPSARGYETASETRVCLNCGTHLRGAFCSRCGQRDRSTNLTLRELVRETFAELTSLEGKVPTTLKALFSTPGKLTREVLAGRRARWVAPLRLYLICSVAFFLSGPIVEAITGRNRPDIANVRITNPDGTPASTLTPEIRAQIREGLPARIFGADRIERAFVDSDRINDEIRLALPKAMFVLVPIFAMLTRIVWRRRSLRYPAHLYHALHVHAAVFGAFTVAAILVGTVRRDLFANVVASVAASYALWYAAMSVHRVFDDSWPGTVFRLVLVAVPYLATLFLTSLLIFGYAIFRV